ncbi:MAG TPA: hypothetical protein VF434_08605 [Promineifilum sp.]
MAFSTLWFGVALLRKRSAMLAGITQDLTDGHYLISNRFRRYGSATGLPGPDQPG